MLAVVVEVFNLVDLEVAVLQLLNLEVPLQVQQERQILVGVVELVMVLLVLIQRLVEQVDQES